MSETAVQGGGVFIDSHCM